MIALYMMMIILTFLCVYVAFAVAAVEGVNNRY